MHRYFVPPVIVNNYYATFMYNLMTLPEEGVQASEVCAGKIANIFYLEATGGFKEN